MFKTINPLAATLLVAGTALGFTAHAALASSSEPTSVVKISDGPSHKAPVPSSPRPRPCYWYKCAV
jgi:hypothetical protein